LFPASPVEQHPHAKHGHEQTNIKANSPHELLGSNRRSKYQTLPSSSSSSSFFFSFSNCEKKNMMGQTKTMNMGKRQKEVFRWATHTHKICQNVQTFIRV